jgi:hypothetical protein
VLISKVIQNLANNVMFGEKESFLLPFNQLLTKHKANMRDFLDRISTVGQCSECVVASAYVCVCPCMRLCVFVCVFLRFRVCVYVCVCVCVSVCNAPGVDSR